MKESQGFIIVKGENGKRKVPFCDGCQRQVPGVWKVRNKWLCRVCKEK